MAQQIIPPLEIPGSGIRVPVQVPASLLPVNALRMVKMVAPHGITGQPSTWALSLSRACREAEALIAQDS